MANQTAQSRGKYGKCTSRALRSIPRCVYVPHTNQLRPWSSRYLGLNQRTLRCTVKIKTSLSIYHMSIIKKNKNKSEKNFDESTKSKRERACPLPALGSSSLGDRDTANLTRMCGSEKSREMLWTVSSHTQGVQPSSDTWKRTPADHRPMTCTSAEARAGRETFF